MTSEIFMQLLLNGLVVGSIYGLIALGYTMVYGIIQLINFAHGEVLMVGAMVSWTVATFLLDTASPMPGWLIMLIWISCSPSISLAPMLVVF